MTLEHLCHLCGSRAAGSREHLPGVGASNRGPVAVTYLSAPAGSGGVQPVTRLERDGFVVRTICDHCNQRTGGNYGTAYKEFVTKFAASGVLDAGARRTWVSLSDIQPLRVVKQMASMLLAAQPTLEHQHWAALRGFVLRRDERLPDDAPRLYLYRNTSGRGRLAQLCSIASAYGRFPMLCLAEISWPPVGIVYALGPHPPSGAHPLVSQMADITHWGRQYGFRDRASFGLSVPQLGVATHWPLGFGSERDAHAWSKRDGVMVGLTGGPRGDGGVELPALTERVVRRPAS